MKIGIPSDDQTDLTQIRTALAETDRRGQITGTSLTQIQDRVAHLEDGSRHAWTGSGALSSGSDIAPTLSMTESAGVATIVGGVLFLNRPGRWALSWYGDSSSTVTGEAHLYLAWAGGAFPAGMSNKIDTRWRGLIGGTGLVRQSVEWVGWVPASKAHVGITPRAAWFGSSAVGCNYTLLSLQADYLGGPIA